MTAILATYLLSGVLFAVGYYGTRDLIAHLRGRIERRRIRAEIERSRAAFEKDIDAQVAAIEEHLRVCPCANCTERRAAEAKTARPS